MRSRGKTLGTCSRGGITLVEVLVALGIVALLVAMITPALSSFRTRASLTVASQNLRSIVAGFNLYAGDNNGMYPATGNDCSRMQATWNGGYLSDRKVFINPINQAKGTPVGNIYLGASIYVPCYFSANSNVFTNWSLTGGAIAAPVRVTDSPSIPLIYDQRADRLWNNNYVTLPNGKPGGLFGYPDGVVLLLGAQDSVVRSR